MGSIYLIRHGQASFGADNYDVLSPVGEQQASILGQHLATLGISFDRCLSGDLKRQQDTGKGTMQQLQAAGFDVPTLEIDPAFNEFDADQVIHTYMGELLETEPHALEIMRNGANNRAEFQRLFSKLINMWVSGNNPRDDVPSWQSFVDRVRDALDRILATADKKDRIAIFTSGGTITAVLQSIIGMPPGNAFELNWQIVNTSVNLVKFRGNDMALASFNSYAHLELLKKADLITFR